MGAVRSRLRRWHVWLGWIVGLPILLWMMSGLAMVAKPIEEVRGEHLLRAPKPMRLLALPVVPKIERAAISSLSLERRAAGPRWIVKLSDGTSRQANPANGALLPPLSAADAVREVVARYLGEAKVQSAAKIDPEKPPLDLRRPVAAWKVAMDDGTHFYVDAGSGAIVATRTRWWRFYDLMWGLHIMDLKTREDTHNPLIIGFALVSLAMVLLALVQLPLTVSRRRARPGLEPPSQPR